LFFNNRCRYHPRRPARSDAGPPVRLWQAGFMSDRVRAVEPSGGTFRRDDALRRLAQETFDVLVIGGGITGAGVALDAASRGLKTALVEKDDFASGTSSKSSKLIHGGLRYLQQHEYRLVYENLAERQRLLDNAPHLVSPLPFLIPLFGRGGVVNRSVARVYRTALWLYDLTGGVRIGHRHEKVSRAQALAHLPYLRAEQLVAGFLYWDARADDARLTLTVLRTAVLDHGAVAANHTSVTGLTTGADGRVDGADVVPVGGTPFTVRASVVVNAAGVWSDTVRAFDETNNPHSIRPAKGIHITVPEAAYPCDIAAVIPVRQDHRSIFVVSWGDQVYLGTTDTEWDGPLDDPSCLPEDVDYILEAANAVTTHPISRSDITGIWTGLRPLLAPEEGRHAPSERTADLSRRHTVRTSPTGLVTVTGGKLTTYRKMAQDTVDAAAALLGRPAGPCITRSLRLRGARGAPPRSDDAFPLVTDGDRDRGTATDRAAAVAAHLAGRFGSETPAVLSVADTRPELLDPLVPGLHYLAAEAVYAAQEEMAGSVADVLDRRTRASLRDARGAADAAPRVAALIGPVLGWDDERARLEAESYAQGIRTDLARAGLDPYERPVDGSRGPDVAVPVGARVAAQTVAEPGGRDPGRRARGGGRGPA
jgi:glycerol-3-phosphate dehydrogenase